MKALTIVGVEAESSVAGHRGALWQDRMPADLTATVLHHRTAEAVSDPPAASDAKPTRFHLHSKVKTLDAA